MRLAFHLALRQIRFRRLRSGSIGVVVAIAVSCVAAVSILDRNTILSRQAAEIRLNGDPDLVMTFAGTRLGDVRSLAAELKANPDVRGVLCICRHTPPMGEPVRVVFGDLPAFRFVNAPTGAGVFAGPSLLTPLARFEFDGSSFEPKTRFPRRYYPKRAGQRGYYLFFEPEEFSLGIPVDPVLWIRTSDPEAVRARYASRALVQDAPHRSRWMTAEDIAMRAAVKLSSLLALVLSAFVLGHTTRLGLIERTRELAVLRALGMGRRRLVRLGLLEVLLVALPAALVGIGVGAGAAFVLGRIGISTLGRDWILFWHRDLPWPELGAVFTAGIAFPLVGAWLSLRVVHILDVPPALGPVFQARPPTAGTRRAGDLLAVGSALALALALAWLIAGFENPRVEAVLLRGVLVGVAALTVGLLLPAALRFLAVRLSAAVGGLFGPMGRLAARTWGSGHLPALAGVVGVFSIVLTLQNLVTSMSREIEGWGRRALADRAYVRFTDPMPAGRLPPSRGARRMPVTREWLRPVNMRAVDLDALVEIAAEEDRPMLERLAAGEGVLVSRALAIQQRLAPGSTYRMPTTRGLVAVPVLAVTDRYGAIDLDRAYALVGHRFAERHLGVPPGEPFRGVLLGAPEPLLEEEIQNLTAGLGAMEYHVTMGRGRLMDRLAKVRRDFLVFNAIWVFLVLLAGAGTGATIFLRSLERRRELALYRVLGATRREFAGYFRAQGFTIGLVGGGFALLLALPLSRGAVWALERLSGMEVEFAWSYVAAGVCWALAILTGSLAGAIAARISRGIDWPSALKYE